MAFLLAVGQGLDPRPAPAQPSLTHISAQLKSDCLEGFNWPGGVQVHVELRDSGGNLVYATTAATDPSGHFVVNPQGQPYVFCDIPVTLHPGMTYTASDGSTTKSLLIEDITFDLLDPDTDTAAGTAPAGRTAQVSVYWGGQAGNNAQNVYLFTKAGPEGSCPPALLGQLGPDRCWFVDVRANGGQVEPDSQGDAFLADDGADGNFDFTKTTIWVTAVSLDATAGAASSAIARAAGAQVVGRGGPVRLSGQLSAGTRACVRRKRVRLLKLVGKRSRVLASTRTNKKGRYSFLRAVERTTRFQVRYPGDQTCQRSLSRAKTVRAARRIGASA